MICFIDKGSKMHMVIQCLLFSLQDMLFIKQNVSLLNGPVARMTALISVIFAELTIIGKFNSKNSVISKEESLVSLEVDI